MTKSNTLGSSEKIGNFLIVNVNFSVRCLYYRTLVRACKEGKAFFSSICIFNCGHAFLRQFVITPLVKHRLTHMT